VEQSHCENIFLVGEGYWSSESGESIESSEFIESGECNESGEFSELINSASHWH